MGLGRPVVGSIVRLRSHRLAAVAAVLVCSSVVQHGAAASMPTSSSRLSGATATVQTCDANGFGFRYATDSSGQITAVTVDGIAAACAGGALRLTLTSNGASVGQGTATLPATGFSGSVVVSIAPTPAADQVTAADAVIEGP
jgi:hypothetical protein